MQRPRGKAVAVTQGALVGDKLHRNAARLQHMSERLRRKQMPAGAAGGKENGAIVHAGAPTEG